MKTFENFGIDVKKIICRFLLQCLEDLDTSLRRLNSRLFVIRYQPTTLDHQLWQSNFLTQTFRGQPADVLPSLFKEWGTTYFTFEEDPEPFGRVGIKLNVGFLKYWLKLLCRKSTPFFCQYLPSSCQELCLSHSPRLDLFDQHLLLDVITLCPPVPWWGYIFLQSVH